jgi:heme-degrading monooxygenase HmoA
LIVEHAILDVASARAAAYEAALAEAVPLMTVTPGFIAMDVRPCVEKAGRYLLRVEWQSLEAHIEGFRGSDNYKRWSALLHPFYDPFLVAEHYGAPVVSR